MSTITFDKMAYIDTLKAAGFDEAQARAQATALDAALKDTVATKYDLMDVKSEVGELKVRIDMLQWMVGAVGVGVLMLVLRTFWS
jgi:Spy/CpxP family protein refolding chaperone